MSLEYWLVDSKFQGQGIGKGLYAEMEKTAESYGLKNYCVMFKKNDPVLADKVGQSMSHALKISGLGLGTLEIEAKIQYRQMAREYHPDKNNPEVTGLTMTEASDFFKLLNNANMFLRG
jgi:GNAT superfamily N-acetyltransferase